MIFESIKSDDGEITRETFETWAAPIEKEMVYTFWQNESETERLRELRNKLNEHVIGQLILFPEEEKQWQAS